MLQVSVMGATDEGGEKKRETQWDVLMLIDNSVGPQLPPTMQ